MTAWAEGGWSVTWRSKVAHLMPPVPAGAPAPQDWADPDAARGRLAAAGLSTKVERRNFAWRYPSTEAAFDALTTTVGTFVAFIEDLEPIGKADEGRGLLREAIEESNVASNGSCTLPAPYLLILATP
jgi:hypothetical protein